MPANPLQLEPDILRKGSSHVTKEEKGSAIKLMKYPPIIAISFISLQLTSQASPTSGTLAVDTLIPIAIDDKTVGSVTLKAGSEVSILQVLPDNKGVLISRGESSPAKIPVEALSSTSLQAPAVAATTTTPTQATAPATVVVTAATPDNTSPCVSTKDKEVSVYSTPAGYHVDSNITMTVNGQNIPVLKWTTGKKSPVEYLYSRFALSGPATVKITCSKPVDSCRIQPSAFGIESHVSGQDMTFTLPGSRYFIISINHTDLMVLADPPENKATHADDPHIHFLSPSADPTGQQNCTATLQNLIDSTADMGGGVAYIPCGTFKVGPFRLKSNVTLYLADGAVLKFDPATSGVPKDFSKVVHHDHEKLHSGLYFIKADDAQNIRIAGRGMIDLNAGTFFEVDGWLNSCMRIQNVQNFDIEGITIRENSSWSILTAACKGVCFHNIKVLNGMGFEQNDAFDIISCNDVLIEHCFARASDDVYCLKGGGAGTHGGGITTPLTTNFGKITVQDCVAYTRDGSGFKMGNQSSISGNDFTCKNLYAIAGRNAVFLALFDGPAIFQNICVDNVFIDQKNMIPFKVEIRKGGQVKDIKVTNVYCKMQPVSIHIPQEMKSQQ